MLIRTHIRDCVRVGFATILLLICIRDSWLVGWLVGWFLVMTGEELAGLDMEQLDLRRTVKSMVSWSVIVRVGES